MESTPPTPERTAWSRRTTVLTLAASAVVLLGGMAAMALALGLFDGGSQTRTTVAAGSGTRWSSQSVEAGSAGRLVIERSGEILRISSVEPAAGWTWTQLGTESGRVAVRFESTGGTYDLVAGIAPDGTVQTMTIPQTPGAAPPPGTDDSHGSDHPGGHDDHGGFPKGHDDDD